MSKKNNKNKFFSLLLIVCVVLIFILQTQRTEAWVAFDPPTTATTGAALPIQGAITGTTGTTAAATTVGTGVDITAFGYTITKDISASTLNLVFTAYKILTLLAVQTVTQAIIGDGDAGAIPDWNDYLYVSPQQRAIAQMNSFFNTTSRGRLSRLNYEGIGPNYDAYLVAQARMAIAGQPFTTNLQDLVTDPTQMFAGGNMKGIMTYMQCANNVSCYSLTSTARYNLEFAKAQEIAKNEQFNGFLPKKSGGKITRPASILFNTLSQVDQLGTQVIMNTEAKEAKDLPGAYAQLAGGALINIGARTFNYMSADTAGKDAIRNKNDQFPFSLAYSLNGGLGISAGGVTVNTGAGAFSGDLQIGNTCASGNFTVDLQGVTTDITGKRITCPKGSVSNGSIKAPSINVTVPSITCSTDKQCQDACNGISLCKGNVIKCSASKCILAN